MARLNSANLSRSIPGKITSNPMTSDPRALGLLIRAFPKRPLRWQDLLFVLLPGICATLLPLLYGKSRYDYGLASYGPVAASTWSRPWYALSIFALIIFIILVTYRLRLSRQFIAFHENGLYIALSKRQRLLWHQIAGIASGTVQYHFFGWQLTRKTRAYLYPNIGKAIQLKEPHENLPELITRIKAKLYPRLFKLIKSNFQEGKWLHFGPLALQTQYLVVGDHRYLWSQVNQIAVQSGDLLIKVENNKQFCFPIANIPNLEILVQLIQEEVKV